MTGESRSPKLVEPGREERAARVETAVPEAGCACLVVVRLRCSAGVRRLGWRLTVGLALGGRGAKLVESGCDEGADRAETTWRAGN